jgi:hypothetical protein
VHGSAEHSWPPSTISAIGHELDRVLISHPMESLHMHETNKPDVPQSRATEESTETGSAWKPLLWVAIPLAAVILWQLFLAP